MMYKNRKFVLGSLFLGIALNMLGIQATNAQISNLPPLVKAPISPNIVFTLDDSGSMQLEAVPDSNASVAAVGFPVPVGIYSPGVRAASSVMGFGHTLNIARFRSFSVNPIYYNPNVSYSPWVDSNNVSLGNANITAARFNPVNPTGVASLPTIDLTSTSQKVATGCADWRDADEGITAPDNVGCGGGNRRRDFYPALYYRYNGGGACNTNTLTCFTRIQITPANAPFTNTAGRTNCANPTSCTYAEEIQNFANWFQYWRSRVLIARGGVGQAFGSQPTALRVGYGTINTTNTIISGVKEDFAGTNRSNFFDFLYSRPLPNSGTPLRLALDEVGQYFRQTGINGPWQNVPGDATSGQATCRQNFHILMTDGYWNGSGANSPRNANVDNTAGPVINGPNGATYQYQPSRPYRDNNGDTLADVALYYWANDLRPDWTAAQKNVPTSTADPAWWPHLVNFTVGLGVQATLNPATDLPALTSGALSWPTPGANSVNNVDDLWHAAVNSRGQFFSASNPTDFARALTDSLQTISNRTGGAAAVGTSTSVIRAGGSLFTSNYRTDNWSGQIEQRNLDAAGNIVTSPAGWLGSAPAPASRQIFTYVDNTLRGRPFTYANLAASDRLYFDTAAATYTAPTFTGANLVDYIRGENFTGLRQRSTSTPFGDFVNSAPQYIKAGDDEGYALLPAGTPGASTYNAFVAAKASRTAMVYVGSNDGMLHALNGSTGVETFAYVPKAVMSTLPLLASPNYTHRFYVDGTPNIADAYISGWKTILAGATGAGGRSVFALDVTNPTSFSQSNVLWELNSAIDGDIGYTIGVPQIGRTPQGDWVAIFGNGYRSNSNRAVLFVVRLSDGQILRKFDTGVGSASLRNGLATPKLLIGSDATIQAVYAGDQLGNLWKFDLTTNAIAFSSTPLFTAVRSGIAQPITVQPEIVRHPNGGFLITFGTGKIFEDIDSTNTDVQSLYGIWDRTGIAAVTPTRVSSRSLLQQQTFTKMTAGTGVFYELTDNTVNWTNQRGWYIDLNVESGERLVINPQIFFDQAILTTTVPSGSTNSCASDGFSTTLSIRTLTGGRLPYRTIDVDFNGTINTTDAFYSGIRGELTFGTSVLTKGSNNKRYQINASNGSIISSPAPTCPAGKICGQDGKILEAPTLRLWRQILGKD